MSNRKFKYPSDAITVSYDPKICIHAAECVHGLPEVFDPKKKPWVNPDVSTPDEIEKVILRCPSGALKYERHDTQNQEQPPVNSSIKTVKNGPLYLGGNIEIFDNEGNLIAEETRVALCRCGESSNKPFCDYTHIKVNFNAD